MYADLNLSNKIRNKGVTFTHCHSIAISLQNLVTALDTTYIRREPLGVVMVISAWNYPVQLGVVPIAGAIAAGNTVLFKPSELAPATSAALKASLAAHMDNECIATIEGGVPETQEILKQRFDHIFFTGTMFL